MAGYRPEQVADNLATITTETVWQKDGGDMKLELAPGERASGHVTIDASGAVDIPRITIYKSDKPTPGAVPDSSLALNAQDDWAVYNEFTIDTTVAAIDDAPQPVTVSGSRFFAFTLQRDAGTTNTFIGDLRMTQDGVEAS